MKKLLLTSYACQTIQFVDQLLDSSPSNTRVAFIPTAADPEKDKSFVEIDRQALLNHGFALADLDLKGHTPETIAEKLSKVDLVFVSGGNTFYLLDQVRKSGFDKVLPQKLAEGLVYVGSSAGSVVACPSIGASELFDSPTAAPNLANYTGLNLVDFLVIPHFEKKRYTKRLQQTIVKWSDQYQLYPLTDTQALVVNGENTKLVESDPA